MHREAVAGVGAGTTGKDSEPSLKADGRCPQLALAVLHGPRGPHL